MPTGIATVLLTRIVVSVQRCASTVKRRHFRIVLPLQLIKSCGSCRVVGSVIPCETPFYYGVKSRSHPGAVRAEFQRSKLNFSLYSTHVETEFPPDRSLGFTDTRRRVCSRVRRAYHCCSKSDLSLRQPSGLVSCCNCAICKQMILNCGFFTNRPAQHFPEEYMYLGRCVFFQINY